MPKPNKHVFVCAQSRPPGHPRGSCGQNNSNAVFDEFLGALQLRDLMGVQVTASGCIGPCNMGPNPNVLVYPEGVMYQGVKTEDVASIIEEHLIGGKPVERLLMPEEIWG